MSKLVYLLLIVPYYNQPSPMIKFFRTIRQKLISEGKTVNYLKYAVGEIILVVIGILIALQVNTWNNVNLNKQKEKEYLDNLIEDLNTQEGLINIQFKHEAKMKANCEKALEELNSNNINGDSISSYLGNVTRRTFVVHDPTFQDLKSSGNILLIKDNALRKKILSFYQYLEYCALVIQTSNETSIAVFRDFLFENNVVNMNNLDNLTVAGGVDFSIKTIDVPWAKNLQEESFKDKKHLLKVLNTISARGRTSSVNLDLMKSLKNRIEIMNQELVKYLNP